MKQLFLLRHGIAAQSSPNQTDAQIPLTQEGIQILLSETIGMKKLGVVPQLILSSPLQRAKETAQLVANELNPKLKDLIEINEHLVPYGNPADVLFSLASYNHFESVMLVSHQPLMGSLAGCLTQRNGAHLPFEKGSLCSIAVTNSPTVGREKLNWLLTPQQLIEAGSRP